MLKYKKQEDLQKLRDLVFSYFISHPSEATEFEKELNFLRRANSFYEFVIPYEYPNSVKAQSVEFDETCQMFFVTRKGKRLYLPHRDQVSAINYYHSLLIEQDKHSPHYYPEGLRGTVLVDVGAAEGIFALDNVNNFQKIVLIECDKAWITALEKTFEPWREKVQIIQSFVDETNTLSNLLSNYDLNQGIIKMDIEGYEMDALKGLVPVINTVEHLQLFVCAYHKQEAAKEIIDFAYKYGFVSAVNEKYMLFVYDDLTPPFFRKGLITLLK